MNDVERNRGFFEKIVELLSGLAPGDPDGLTLAAYAARFNLQRVTGYYSCPALERHYLALGRSLPQAAGADRPRGDLHVLTAVPYNGGGHTQLVLDWIDHFGPQEPQDVALIDQRDHLPPTLIPLVEASGGEIHYNPSPGNVAGAALWLRSLAGSRRRVVLSHHMYDPLPVAAFGHPEFRGPVFFINHSDHEFSLGRSVADLWIEFRPDLSEVTARHRGHPESLILPPRQPRPEVQENSKTEEAEARRRCGLPENAFVVLTVSQPYKFTPVAGFNFPAFVAQNLAANSNLFHILVGPERDDPLWAKAAAWRDSGRLRLCGGRPKSELGIFLKAADVYLDSFPFGGGLASLDAVGNHLPVLARFIYEYNLLDLFRASDALFENEADLAAALRRLKDDPQARKELAARQFELAFNQQREATRRRAFETAASYSQAHRLTPDWPIPFSVHPREDFRNQLKMNIPGYSARDLYGKMKFWIDRLRRDELKDSVRQAWRRYKPQ